ncbi:Hypp8850 [Branchiostoma lanceolatum]|uniref:1-alkyl-2-acetylglycerophosphocholine esterase n=1 Tax=Branchiostoma lanceolatum TaxID=7740 RepID=A0A8J9ZB15_BRALA|nr:Hypp8850 [Branchiostoma lanceolatum]
MATGTRGTGAPGELYRLLDTTTDATNEEILQAYKKKVKIYEETSNTSKDTRQLCKARQKFDEVSKAFYTLSDKLRRKLYDQSNQIVEPAKRNKKAKPNGEYFVQFNDGSVTVHVPVGSSKQWIEAIETYYGTSTVDKGKHGHQLTVPFLEPDSDEAVGSVTFHVYQTCKILVQGSACYLWATYIFEHVKHLIQPRATVLDTDGRCEDTICSKCKRPGPEDEGVIQCNVCHEWYHYSCSGLHESSLCELIQNIASEYVCTLCTTDTSTGNIKEVLYNLLGSTKTQSPTDAREEIDASEETVPKVPREDGNNNRAIASPEERETSDDDKFTSLQNSVDKLEAILSSRITKENNAVDMLLARMADIENNLLSKTKDAPGDKMAKESDIEVLKRRVRSLETENKNLRHRVAALEEKGVKSVVSIATQSDTSATRQTLNEDEQSDVTIVHNIPTNNRFLPLTEDTPPQEEQTTRDNPSSPHSGNRQQRGPAPNRRHNENNNQTQAEIVIIGDSNTKGIIPNILYPGKRIAQYTAMTIPQASGMIKNTADLDPKCIVFHVGTNDIRQEKAANGVTENFRELVNTTHTKYPNAAIVMSTVPPRNDNHLMEVTRDVNSFLQILGQETPFITLADNDNLGDGRLIKQRLYRHDGYHLNKGGLRVMAANWKSAIHPIVGLGVYEGRKGRNDRTPRTRNTSASLTMSPQQSRESGRSAGNVQPTRSDQSYWSPQQSSENGRNAGNVQPARNDQGYRSTNRLPPESREPAASGRGFDAPWRPPRPVDDRRRPASWSYPPYQRDTAIPPRPFSPFVPNFEHMHVDWYPETQSEPRPWFPPEFPQRYPDWRYNYEHVRY